MADVNKKRTGNQPQRGNRNRSRRPGTEREENMSPVSVFVDKVVAINRCAKVVKGGRRFSFSALVVSGDQKGRIGFGFGRANEVSDAIRKGTKQAQKSIIDVVLKESTIPHSVLGVADGGKVLLKPASEGTGVVAGGGIRAVLEALGVRNILTKSLGSGNTRAMVLATLDALKQLRSAEHIQALRRAS